MLRDGYGTLWKEFPTPGEGSFEMYGRPFGKSLPHAWESASAAFLPESLLGVRTFDLG